MTNQLTAMLAYYTTSTCLGRVSSSIACHRDVNGCDAREKRVVLPHYAFSRASDARSDTSSIRGYMGEIKDVEGGRSVAE